MENIGTITVRPRGEFEKRRPRPLIKPSSLRSLNQSRYIILIHGYQNSEAKAKASYLKFRGLLRTALWPREVDTLGSFWGYQWPGNDSNLAISVFTYNVAVGEAESSGHLLYEFIRSCPSGIEIVLIGHSLGCRVAIEAMRRIRGGGQRGGPRVKVILLAAAVSVKMCEPRRTYDWDLTRSDEYVFWSQEDDALGWKFNLGQRLSHEPGMAVGRHGKPSARWTRCVETDLGHGGYWRSLEIAEEIAHIFGRPRDRAIPKLSRKSRNPLTPREAERRSLDERRLSSRNAK